MGGKMKRFKPEGWLMDTPENRAAFASSAALRDAYFEGRILEARALLCDKDHNLHVDLGCMEGIIPREEAAVGIEEGKVRDIAIISRVNKPVMFRITGFDADALGRTSAILSRRSVQLECMETDIARLTPGEVIDARVSHMEGFGVFCDIGAGLSALMPIDSISVSRIPHPSERFRTGEDIRALVKGIDENGRITLTHKELLGTWEQNAAQFKAGETVPGVIRSVEKYGVFVELTPNLAGLAEYVQGVYAGQHASVYIKSLIPERMKIKLIIVDAFDAEYPPPPVTYYTDSDYIDHWIYSPECCPKVVESFFSPLEEQ